ncbi:hypothetical protein BB561_001247 [Smittium simulii]|uniref:CCHC-type domain-containing protein n=1 Tax=Smittium simulii TaxID=133385 RepID=A0A2T9YVI8_9FUNG|nr:hypothetical protein BB561_001247 [Smittium simulii]
MGLAHLRLLNNAFAIKYPATQLTLLQLQFRKFYEYLLPHFIDPSFPQVIRKKLQDLKQTGTLAKYISQKNRYVDILNINNPTTLLDAIKIISKHGTAMDMQFLQSNRDTMSRTKDEKSINDTEVPISVASREGKKFLNKNMICWNCGKKGHKQNECRLISAGKWPQSIALKVKTTDKEIMSPYPDKTNNFQKNSNIIPNNN